jgi:hypothetical protein
LAHEAQSGEVGNRLAVRLRDQRNKLERNPRAAKQNAPVLPGRFFSMQAC